MADPSWPAGLPQKPDRDEWQQAPQPNIVAFQPEVGPPIARRRGTARTYIVQGAFFFTDAQMATFWAFWESTIKDGALAFSWPHPVTGAASRWRFEGEPAARMEGFDRHRLSFSLRKLP